jgi:hypothetical protein
MLGRSYGEGKVMNGRQPKLRSSLRRHALWAVASFLSIAALVRLSAGQSVEKDEIIEDSLHGGSIRPITKADFVGEWNGISVDGNVVLDLRIGTPQGGALLTVTEPTGTSISSAVYRLKKVDECDGRFSVGGPNEPVSLEGIGSVKWQEQAWGFGTLMVHDGDSSPRKLEFYLFHTVDRGPWIVDVLRTADRYGFL